jgi:hypothetical protein
MFFAIGKFITVHRSQQEASGTVRKSLRVSVCWYNTTSPDLHILVTSQIFHVSILPLHFYWCGMCIRCEYAYAGKVQAPKVPPENTTCTFPVVRVCRVLTSNITSNVNYYLLQWVLWCLLQAYMVKCESFPSSTLWLLSRTITLRRDIFRVRAQLPRLCNHEILVMTLYVCWHIPFL